MPSEKNTEPLLLVPERTVTPACAAPAIVKSSAFACPSVVVPINNLPLASNLAMSV